MWRSFGSVTGDGGGGDGDSIYDTIFNLSTLCLIVVQFEAIYLICHPLQLTIFVSQHGQ